MYFCPPLPDPTILKLMGIAVKNVSGVGGGGEKREGRGN